MRNSAASRRSFLGRAAAAIAAVLAGACAPLQVTPDRVSPLSDDAPFELDGRLSARRDREGAAASFTWVHAPPRDAVSVVSPTGQVIAEIEGDTAARRVTLRRADGTRDEASDWSSLTQRALGFALPVDGLAAWARALPHARSPHAAETDASGRVAFLRQDGWEIGYDYAEAARLPSRMRLAYPGLELRIVVDRWR